jgi:uncharacterized protein (DUF488 family)
MTTVYTIGYTHKTAKSFFEKLIDNKIMKLIDIRLNNKSQFAGFTKTPDLQYFLKELCNIDYLYMCQFAPTKEMLDAYKNKEIDWAYYEYEFNTLIKERKIEKYVDLNILNNSCMLCSEETPNKCHRRLVAEYLKKCFGNIEIIHL